MSTRIISVDCGKANTKVYMYDVDDSTTGSAIISTNVAPVNSLVRVCMDESQYIVNINSDDDEINGEWMVGAVGGESSNSNSKRDRIHKIMTLTAIALVTKNGDTVIPAIGCPLTSFEDVAQKEELYDYLLPDGHVDMKINGEDRFYCIEKEKGLIFPESLGALFLFPDYFTGETGVIDIGGLNMNASFFEDKTLCPDLCTTEKLGCSSIITVLRKRLNTLCDANYDNRRIEGFLKAGTVPYFAESADVISDVLQNHIEKIDAVLKDWNTSKIDLVFIGGTTQLLRKYIEDKYKNRVFIPRNSDFINCKGFLKALISLLGYKCPF